jgi:cysteine desulfurase
MSSKGGSARAATPPPRSSGAAMTRRIYLDYNATAPVRPVAREAMVELLTQVGNASSVHSEGRTARAAREKAREAVAALIGARPADIVFTSGGTEANALALRGSGCGSLLVSAGEHPSVLEARCDAQRVPLAADGRIDCDALEALLADTQEPALLSVQLANNETGVIQPIGQVVEVARAAGALVHCDAVQAAGKLPIDVASLGVDLLSLSAHKIGGPQGVGALWVRSGLELRPLQRGGGQEMRRRSGTENLPGIVGFAAAAEEAQGDVQRSATLAAWRDAMEQRVVSAEPQTMIAGSDAPRLANTSCLVSPQLTAELQLMALDLAGFAISSGAACSSGKVGHSHVLEAMGLPARLLDKAVRVSLGWASREEDVQAFAEAWVELHRRRRSGAAVA